MTMDPSTGARNGAPMLQLRGLRKQYGAFTAVKGVDLEVRAGEVFGFLGPNGAGKTTSIRMVAGVLEPTAGQVLVGGHDLHRDPRAAKALLGYIPAALWGSEPFPPYAPPSMYFLALSQAPPALDR